MSIEQNWKQLEEGKDDDLLSILQADRLQQLQSTNPLQKIKRNLFASTIWSIFVSAAYVVVLIKYPYWQVILGIGIILLYTAWGALTSFTLSKNIQPSVAGQQPLLMEMEKQYKIIKRWVRLQLRFAVLAYPAGAFGGYLIGLLFSTGKGIDHVETLLTRPTTVIVLSITTVILVPTGLWLAKRLLHKSYGQHLSMLESNIDALKGDK